MYRHSAVVPWHQDAQDDWIDVRLTVEMLRDVGPFEEIHDLGCGLGYYLALMHRHLGGASRAFGYDISPTACATAKNTFPAFTFQHLDVTAIIENASPISRPPTGAHRLFMMRAVLWYVFPRLRDVVRGVRSLIADGDTLLVVQNFPPLADPFVGKEVIPNHRALIHCLGAAFVPMRYIWYEDTQKVSNDNWFIGLFSPCGVHDDRPRGSVW